MAQDIRQEFKFVKLRIGLAPLCERVGHNVLDPGSKPKHAPVEELNVVENMRGIHPYGRLETGKR